MLVQWHFCKFHHLLPEKQARTQKFPWLASLWLYGEEKDSATPVVWTVRRSSAPRSQIMQGQSGSSDRKHGIMSTSESATTQPPPGMALVAVMFVDGIPQGSEWQFPLLEWYQINDYSNQNFRYKDFIDPLEEDPRVIHLRNYFKGRSLPIYSAEKRVLKKARA